MKILYVITRADLGGAQTHLIDLLEGLQGRVTPEVIVGEHGFLTKHLEDMGIYCEVVPSLVQPIDPINDIRAVFAIRSIIARRKPDLVHLHTSKAGVVGRVAAASLRVPSIFTAHTWCFAEGTSWKWRTIGLPVERAISRFTDCIVNVSEENRRLALRNGVGREPQQITIHNGVADTNLRADPGVSTKAGIICVARFVPQKDQALLLRALHRIASDAMLMFVGDGPTRGEIEALAATLRLSDRVQFLGERRDISELFAAAQLFVLPSRWEGFPLTILEAMRAGLPVIATDVGGVREAVQHSHTGFLTNVGDEADMAQKLETLLSSAELRRQMGAAGRARYEELFTRQGMLKSLCAVYDAVLKKRRTRGFRRRSPFLQNRVINRGFEETGSGGGSRGFSVEWGTIWMSGSCGHRAGLSVEL